MNLKALCYTGPVSREHHEHDWAELVSRQLGGGQQLPHLCPYLPEKGFIAREVGFASEQLAPGYYQALMDQGFRRSGNIFYRTDCQNCQDCQSLRINVQRFLPSRSQRRILKENADLKVLVADPEPSQEKYRLYRQYLMARHGGPDSEDDFEHFKEFLYTSPIHTKELLYYFRDRLIAVSLIDWEPDGMSAVYCYYHPDFMTRSLGHYNILWTLNFCREHNLAWYYLGYFISRCSRMDYKRSFRPNELLVHQQWINGEQFAV